MGWISSDVRKAKKAHTCYCCSRKIKVGDEYLCTFCSDGGGIWSISEHLRCHDLAAELDADYLMDGGEYTTDDFEEAITNLCRSEICSHCNDYDTELKCCTKDNRIVRDCMEKVWEFAKTHFFNADIGMWEERHEEAAKEGGK